jgi:NADH:ubiquinone oxidoreductase subunit F (NADH-binding)
MFCHFVWVALLIFKSISLCLFLFFKYNSCGFCPGYKETLAHMTYILELAEAKGKDSDALVAQAWYVLC